MPYWPLGGKWLTIHKKNWIVYCRVVNVPVFESGGVEGLRFRHNEFVCVC